MVCAKPRTTSLAVGSTIAILYSLCALAYALFPSVVTGFANTVAHGINLRPIETGVAAFTFGDYFVGLVCITLYALVAGYIYGAVRNGFYRLESEQGGRVGTVSAARACH